MRKSILILVLSLVLLLTFGINVYAQPEVVYRVNPDSPPKMGVPEARAAINRVLSHRDSPIIISNSPVQNILLEDDEFVIIISDKAVPGKIIVGYDLITPEIRKIDNSYEVPAVAGTVVNFRDVAGRVLKVFSWKSEDDARLFLDAVHILQQSKSMKGR